MEFKHLNDVWDYLDQFTTVEDMEEALGEIPNKFGSFDIINGPTVEEDGFIEICNSFWDRHYGDYDYAYHTVMLPEPEPQLPTEINEIINRNGFKTCYVNLHGADSCVSLVAEEDSQWVVRFDFDGEMKNLVIEMMKFAQDAKELAEKNLVYSQFVDLCEELAELEGIKELPVDDNTYYYIINCTVSEYESQHERICKTYSEALSHIFEYSDWYCSRGTCKIIRITETFDISRTWRFVECELVEVS